jgi:hypothetical protein
MSGGKMKVTQYAALCIGLALSLLEGPFLAAQKPQPAPAAPIPAQILAAKRIFIANAGGDDHSYDEAFFNGGPARAYNQFYAAMKTWGHFELVSAPGDADLAVEIGFTLPQAEQSVMKGNSLGTPFDPQFHLQIRDTKSNVLLWGFMEHAQWAVLQGNRDRNFDQALVRLITQMEKMVTTQAPADAKTP